MTLLERWDNQWLEAPSKKEIRRAIAIAQAVEELRDKYGEFSYESSLALTLSLRADELLEGR